MTGLLVDDEGQLRLPPAFREETFRLAQCRQCGLVYLPERPAVEDLDVYYDESYQCFKSFEDRGRIMTMLAGAVAKAKFRQIRRLMPASCDTILDYGCGSGTWLLQLSQLGFEGTMIGTDVVDGPLNRLRHAGISAHCCDESNLHENVPERSVGVIHLFHVIEHVPSPKRVLEALRDCLVPGGVVLGQTPNIASLGRRFWGDSWNQWHVPRHFVLFDHKTIRRHAESVGLEVVSITSSLSGATQWAHGVTKWMARRSSRPFRGIGEPLYAPMILAMLPVAGVEAMISHTCHMDFIFRRRA